MEQIFTDLKTETIHNVRVSCFQIYSQPAGIPQEPDSKHFSRMFSISHIKLEFVMEY